MFTERKQVSSGIMELDSLLGGIFIGDNVVWYDDAGSLATVFCWNFIKTSQTQNKPLIYISFDHSPKSLLEKLGPLAQNRLLTILDCFTYGKGNGAEVFKRFYDKKESEFLCQIICLDDPHNVKKVTDEFYSVHSAMQGDVRFVFESLTGMQELWGQEEHVLKFYSQSCPRLYELNTIAYWIIEKRAHSSSLRAHINKIAQVAIELSLKRGKTALTILKAEKRKIEILNKPHNYWSKDLTIAFDSETRHIIGIDIGSRLKEMRTSRGLSQGELAKLIGVTASNVSQVESNQIFPSLPALIKITEILSIDMSYFFQDSTKQSFRKVFKSSERTEVQNPNMPKGSIFINRLTPLNLDTKAEPYLIEILPQQKIPAHFFISKSEEMGYLLSGKLEMKIENKIYTINAGDTVYLIADIPSQWKNPGDETAILLWINLKALSIL